MGVEGLGHPLCSGVAMRASFWGALLSCIRCLCAGEDLLVASADKPFRFPATFTFVVRFNTAPRRLP